MNELFEYLNQMNPILAALVYIVWSDTEIQASDIILARKLKASKEWDRLTKRQQIFIDRILVSPIQIGQTQVLMEALPLGKLPVNNIQ